MRFAKEFNLVGGWSLDLTTVDEHGKLWDFSGPGMRKKALELVRKDEPTFAIGSPTCTNCSTMMNLNWSNVSSIEKTTKVKRCQNPSDVLYRHMQGPTPTRTLFLARAPVICDLLGREMHYQSRVTKSNAHIEKGASFRYIPWTSGSLLWDLIVLSMSVYLGSSL